jgi:hypothetical protein
MNSLACRLTLPPVPKKPVPGPFERAGVRRKRPVLYTVTSKKGSFGGEVGAKEHGRMRSEGKDYIVQDGDVMLFRFNV